MDRMVDDLHGLFAERSHFTIAYLRFKSDSGPRNICLNIEKLAPDPEPISPKRTQQ
jgi:hypothetical protein